VVLEAGTAPSILGSRSEIREAMTNLIFNAVDALPRGGRIVVRCREDRDAALIEVSDNGTGMPDSVKSRIFEPFFTTKGLSGTGLGLSMVYGIVSRHHGTIEVDTEMEVGTTVRMRFPAAEAVRPEPAQVNQEPRVHSARVLVVDDEAEILSVLADALGTVGHEVTTASSGSEGIALFRGSRFDVVLTDLGMADVSGWEVARTVRLEGDPGIVLGLVTGWGATISEEMVSGHGVDFVIGKPFDVVDLIATVNRAIDAVKSRPESGAVKAKRRSSKRSRGSKKPTRGSGASPSARLRT
jgi:CheY-like chemotaxis protein/anti-sigma regulatory factor (Ser/Thr protein kinase)